MKKTLTTWIIVALSFIAYQSWGQISPTYTLEIKNITYKLDTALEFDVYLQHTNASATNFEYAAGQYFIKFNTAILNGGTGSYKIVSSGLPTNMMPRSPSIAVDVLRLAANVPPGAGLGFPMPTTPVLIVKMRVKSTLPLLNTVNPNLVWKDAPEAPPITTVNAYIDVTNTNVTTPPTHSVVAWVPPVTGPTAPVAGTPTQPSCTSATGSVVLSGLPASGTWTLNPGAIAGSGSSYTKTGLTAGTYSWTVTNSGGTSPSSNSIIINAAPSVPTAPVAGAPTQPTCALQTGSVVLSGLPSGNWTINPGAIAGTGSSYTKTGLAAGTYSYTVTNASGCISPASSNVVINAVPNCTPTAPVAAAPTQPTCTSATGSVVLSGLPSGSWTLNPGAIAGSGSSYTRTGLTAGTYSWTVSNSFGTSPSSNSVVVNAQPATPTAPVAGAPTQPTCALQTGSVVLSGLPSGNWTINPGAIAGTGTSYTKTGLAAGTYSYTVTNASGCVSPASSNVVINAAPNCTPTAPVAAAPTQPTCTSATGSVVLSGLPSGSWTLNPGAIAGTGSSYTRTGLTAGTYSWTVSNSFGTSPSSNSVVVNAQPATPTAPVAGAPTQPTCAVQTGSVVLSGLPSGNWTINPGAIAGTGSSYTKTGLAAGTHTFTVTNASGCISPASSNVVINAATGCGVPTAPIAGTPTQPTCAVATGSVVLTGLPATGTWTLNPGAIAGSGTSYTRTGLTAGTYSWTVSNANGPSPSSNSVVINAQPATPTAPVAGAPTQPTCAVQTGSVVLSGLPSGNWTINPGAIAGTGSSYTKTGLAAGTYSYTVTNASGCVSPASSNVVINAATGCGVPTAPIAGTPTQPTCAVATGSVVLSGLPASGTWTLNPGAIAGTGTSYTRTGLTAGTYSWTVSNANGPSPSSNSVVINAQPATPAAPTVGTITQLPSASVVLNGLPSGNWTINPGAIAGSTASATISIAAAGTYNYTVTNAAGCTSAASANVVINPIVVPGNPTYTLKVKNIAYVAGALEFDVYMVHTNPTVTNFEYAAGQYFLNFNTAVLNGGTGTYSIVSSGLPTNMQPRSPSIAGNVLRLAANVPPGAGLGTSIATTTPGTLICKMRLTSSTTLSQIDPALVWVNSPSAPPVTTVNAYVGVVNTNVSTPATHSVDPYVPQGTIPTAPVVGAPTQPTCTVATGSVVLSGLPSGNWTINPGAIAGSGSSYTKTGLTAGTYSWTVSNSFGTSPASANVVINAQPATPSAPTVGTITQPTCAIPTGSVVLNGLPSGNWTINPGAIAGTGASRTITGLTAGTKNYTVTNAAGCTSAASANIVINAATGCGVPTAPVVGTITQPTCAVATGSVVLSGLPATGTWTLNPGAISGSGASYTRTGLAAGTYNFTVSNANGASPASASVVINAQPATPSAPLVGTITQPTTAVPTGSVVLTGLPSGNWTINPGATAGTGSSYTKTGLAGGTYNFTVTNAAGCTSAASASVVIIPVSTGNYCAASGTNCQFVWVAGVSVNGISKPSGAATYSNFTSTVFNMNAGTASLVLTPGTALAPTSYPMNWKVWIDYNGDKDFTDAGEEVVSAIGATNLAAVTRILNVPMLTISTRMRVAHSYGGPVSNGGAVPTSCGTVPYGEYEDYTIVISTSAPAVPTGLSFNNITSTTGTAQCVKPALATGFSWRYRVVGTNTWTVVTTGIETFTMTGLTPSTNYEVQVSANNYVGSSAYSASGTFTTLSTTPVYCSAQGNNWSYLWIEGISLNGTTKASGAAGYSNFTSTILTAVAGTTSYLTLDPGVYNGYAYGIEWRVWVDQNKDGDFDDIGESKVNNVTGVATTAISAPLTLPLGTTGSVRMRVRMRYLVSGETALPCGNFAYGEVEDYTINIAAAPALAENSSTSGGALKNITSDVTETSSLDKIVELTVYPNPANEMINFNINLKEEVLQTVSVVDILGKSMIQMNASTLNQNQINLGSDMPTGIYFLYLTTDKGQYSEKFTIVK